MTFEPGDIVMTLKGNIHWTFIEATGGHAGTECIIQSQMTGRRRRESVLNLRYWKPGD